MVLIAKKSVLLVLLFVLAMNAYAVSSANADLTAVKCTMMSDNEGDLPMAKVLDTDCECPMDQLTCDHCLSMLYLSSPVALLTVELNNPLELSSSTHYSKPYLGLDSVVLGHFSPPPIIL